MIVILVPRSIGPLGCDRFIRPEKFCCIGLESAKFILLPVRRLACMCHYANCLASIRLAQCVQHLLHSVEFIITQAHTLIFEVVSKLVALAV